MNLKDTLNLPRTEFPMRARLPEKEPETLERWQRQELYARLRSARAGGPRYVLHDGPPYANGHIHLGTALNKILKDIVIRSRAMAGFDVPYVPGWDCHGMPIEHRVIREMGEAAADAETLEIRDRCREYARRFVRVQREEFERLGAIGDWGRPYLTMDPAYEAEILQVFKELVDDGYISKGLRSIHWCGTCQTALAEAELEYAVHVSPSIYVGFPLQDDDAARRVVAPHLPGGTQAGDVELVIWTTTPWTIPANLAIAVHPDLEYALVEVDASSFGDEDDASAGPDDWLKDGRRKLVLVAADLVDRVVEETGIPSRAVTVAATFGGGELEGLRYGHPLFDRTAPVILSEYVTLEQGSGLVHTAPGHGQEDFELGRRYELGVLCPVDAAGVFDADAGPFAGRQVFDANPDVVRALRDAGALLSVRDFEHSYPHCWRCKSPLIYRATEQWFLNVDTHRLRDRLLSTIRDDVRWVPGWGRERIAGMVESRPDWCLSRQRHWGVPIPALYCGSCDEVRIDPEVVERAIAVVGEEGSDAWFRRPAPDFIPEGTSCASCGGSEFVQERDIFDVWFESGVSHRAVLDPASRGRDAGADRQAGDEEADGGQWPADLYLEGHDQHRGWFQVSLVTGVSTRGRAPYETVVTHGFVLDEDGHKMSKSRGNVIAPAEIWETYGADLMRLYFASVDYTRDVPFSEGLLEPVVESYRKIRNTLRFLLGNLHDFDPVRDRVEGEALEPVDRWILDRAAALGREVSGDYESFRFHRAVHRMHDFCAVSLSAAYLDIVKDRLYCSRPDDPGRRAAQTAQLLLADALCRWLAPVLPFTAEEVWGHLPGDRADSVHLVRFPDLGEHALDDAERRRLAEIMEVREVVLGLLERARENDEIGSSLEAAVHLRKEKGGEETALDLYFDRLPEFFIVSQVHRLDADEHLPPAAVDGEGRAVVGGWRVAVAPARGEKCERCWMWRRSVGAVDDYPTLCRRCVDVVRSVMA